MANSKVLLLMGLVFAVVVLTSSKVLAREFAEILPQIETAQIGNVEEASHGDRLSNPLGHDQGRWYGHRGMPGRVMTGRGRGMPGGMPGRVMPGGMQTRGGATRTGN